MAIAAKVLIFNREILTHLHSWWIFPAIAILVFRDGRDSMKSMVNDGIRKWPSQLRLGFPPVLELVTRGPKCSLDHISVVVVVVVVVVVATCSMNFLS